MKNIYGIKFDDLVQYFESINEKKFRAIQVFEWLYKKSVSSFDEMNNIGSNIIEKLKNDFSFDRISIIKKQESSLTKKYLFKLLDGNYIESVLMEHDYGLSICVSSQVGCNMGCKFCESGRLKKVRNLEPYEIIEQILLIESDINKRISSIVVMGIGEPFDNYDNIINALIIANDNKALEIGARHITVSTCGLIPKIKEYSDLPYQFNLAISLHAPNDDIRDSIMPINSAYKINDLINEIKSYIVKTNRRVTIEYVMLKDINDSKENALELCKLLRGLNIYVNLIKYNETNNLSFKRSIDETIMEFYDILKKNNINVTIRKEFGMNIDAACGQLRSKEVK